MEHNIKCIIWSPHLHEYVIISIHSGANVTRRGDLQNVRYKDVRTAISKTRCSSLIAGSKTIMPTETASVRQHYMVSSPSLYSLTAVVDED